MATTMDAQLLRQWLESRDAEAFHELVNNHGSMVYGVCCRILRSEIDAEDVTQDCFQTLVTLRKPPKGPMGPWLHRLATHRSFNYLRGEKRRKEREEVYEQEEGDIEISTSDSIQWKEIYALVDEALDSLPQKYRKPLIEHFLQNRSHRDIAGSLGISHPTISKRIDHGLELLRVSLKKKGMTVPLSGLVAFFEAESAKASIPVTITQELGRLALSGPCLSGVGSVLLFKGILSGVSAKIIMAAITLILSIGAGTWMSFNLNPEKQKEYSGELLVDESSNTNHNAAQREPVKEIDDITSSKESFQGSAEDTSLTLPPYLVKMEKDDSENIAGVKHSNELNEILDYLSEIRNMRFIGYFRTEHMSVSSRVSEQIHQ